MGPTQVDNQPARKAEPLALAASEPVAAEPSDHGGMVAETPDGGSGSTEDRA